MTSLLRNATFLVSGAEKAAETIAGMLRASVLLKADFLRKSRLFWIIVCIRIIYSSEVKCIHFLDISGHRVRFLENRKALINYIASLRPGSSFWSSFGFLLVFLCFR